MPVFRPMPPMPGESLSGLVARAAGTNLYDRSSDILSFAGLGRQHPESIAFTGVHQAPTLAWQLGVPAKSIEVMFHRQLDRMTVDFFGVPLRDVFIERTKRWLSPARLRSVPYVRAIWQVRTFSFDPVTLGPLICHCPDCGGELGFRVTQGIQFCDHCRHPTPMGFDVPSVDLSRIEQVPFEVDDRPALDFVTGLLDPEIATAPDDLPAAFDGLNRGQLFEIAQAIATAIKMNADGIFETKRFSRSEIGAIEPRHLAKAGRAMLNFPEAFGGLCREAGFCAGNRPGEWGILKAFGALALLSRDRYLDRAFRSAASSVLSSVLSDGFDKFGIAGKGGLRPELYAPLRTLKDTVLDSQPTLMRLAEHPKTRRIRVGSSPKAPVLLHRSQAQMTLMQFKDQIPSISMALALGIPPDAVCDLVHRRHLFVYAGMASDIRVADTYMSGRQLSLLINRLTDGKVVAKPDATFCTFTEAMLMFPAGRRPWAPLIERMIDGRLEYRLHKRPGRGLLKAISVSGVELVRHQLMAEQAAMPAPRLSTVSAGSAVLMLGISVYDVFQALVKAGALTADADGSFSYSQVLAFGAEYIFANEAAVRGRRSANVVRQWVSAHGIQPAFDFAVKCGLIYRRQDIEPMLEMPAMRPEST